MNYISESVTQVVMYTFSLKYEEMHGVDHRGVFHEPQPGGAQVTHRVYRQEPPLRVEQLEWAGNSEDKC